MSDPKQELVEGLCGVMHDAYEAAASKAGWETQERSRKPWADVPEANKVTMRAAVSAALDALTFMGWVSPEDHHETLNDYGQAVGDLNLANHRLGRVHALAEELDAADSGSNAADYRLARFIVSEIRGILAEPAEPQ